MELQLSPQIIARQVKSIFEDKQSGSGSLDAVRIVEFAVQASQLWAKNSPFPQRRSQAEPVFQDFKRASKLYRLQLKNAEMIGGLKALLTQNGQPGFNATIAAQLGSVLQAQLRMLLILFKENAALHSFKTQLESMLNEVKALDPQKPAQMVFASLDRVLNHLAEIHAASGLISDDSLTQKLNRYAKSIRAGMTKADQMSAAWYRSDKQRNRSIHNVLRPILKFIHQQHQCLSKMILPTS
jgi:hypothetical protein